MSNENNKPKPRPRPLLMRIVMWLAEITGVYDQIFETGRNSVIAEISVIERYLAGELMDRCVRITSATAIQHLKWVLMEGSDWRDIANAVESEERKYKDFPK